MFVAAIVAAIHHWNMAPTVSCSPCDPTPRTGTGVTAGGLSEPVGADSLSPVDSSLPAGLNA